MVKEIEREMWLLEIEKCILHIVAGAREDWPSSLWSRVRNEQDEVTTTFAARVLSHPTPVLKQDTRQTQDLSSK